MALNGGKTYLAKRIIELMPPHTHYAEPYFGGGAVLFAKNPQGVSETVNDINGELTRFWGVLQNLEHYEAFVRLTAMTPVSDVEWENAISNVETYANAAVDNTNWSCEIKAWAFFVKYRLSRQALGKDYVTPTRRTRRGMNEQVSAWLSAVEGLPEAHERLMRVEIRNMDAIDFIKKYDHSNALFYCDPPYLHETRVSTDAYENEMNVEQHRELLNCLLDIKSKFILSGYDNKTYETFRLVHKWNRVDIKIDNKASSAKTKEIKTECLWMNYATN